jgi:hypothetical protein
VFPFCPNSVGLLSDINLLYTAVNHHVLSRYLCGAPKHWTPSKSWDISVAIVTGLQAVQQRNRGSIPGKGERFFSSSTYQDQLCIPFPDVQKDNFILT